MTDTNAKPSLEALKALLAQFSAADVKKLLTETEKAKPTLLSVTMDAIVSATRAGSVVTDNVVTDVTTRAIAAKVLDADEKAQPSSVASLIRYYKAAVDAIGRAHGSVVWGEPEKTEEGATDAAEGADAGEPATEGAAEEEKPAEPVTPATNPDYVSGSRKRNAA